MPTPGKGEKKSAFISEEGRDQKQAVAICYSKGKGA